MEKLIINFTPTGMIPTKRMNPNVPTSPDEIIKDVLKSLKYGVSIVHIHARDELTGAPTYDKNTYAKIIRGIRAVNRDVIICVSTSGRNFPEFEKRSQVLDLIGNLKPDMASLTLSSLNFNKQASISTPQTIKGLAQKMQERGIMPELEAFDVGMINYAKYLIRKNLLAPPYYFNLILGNIACAQADFLHLGMMINELPPNSYWSCGGVGDFQLFMNTCGIIGGGGIRVGLEDNIFFDKRRTVAATNEMLLRRAKIIADTYGVKIAKPKEVREFFRLPRRPVISEKE